MTGAVEDDDDAVGVWDELVEADGAGDGPAVLGGSGAAEVEVMPHEGAVQLGGPRMPEPCDRCPPGRRHGQALDRYGVGGVWLAPWRVTMTPSACGMSW